MRERKGEIMNNNTNAPVLTEDEQSLKYEVGYIYSFIGAFAISRITGGVLIYIIRNVITLVETLIIQGKLGW